MELLLPALPLLVPLPVVLRPALLLPQGLVGLQDQQVLVGLPVAPGVVLGGLEWTSIATGNNSFSLVDPAGSTKGRLKKNPLNL